MPGYQAYMQIKRWLKSVPAHGWCLSALLCLHFAGVIGLLGWREFLSEKAVVDYDYGVHFYRAALLSESGAFPGPIWDPGYMGGYTIGGLLDVDNRLGELGIYLLRFLPASSAWNYTLLLLFCWIPVSAYLAARWSGMERNGSVVASFIGCLLFWGMRRGDHAFVTWGMYGWVVASVAIVTVFAAFQKALQAPGVKAAMALGLTGALAGYAHILTALYVPL